MKRLLGFTLGLLIGTCIMIPLILLKLENNKLHNEIGKLEQDIIEYKWELEQVPLIMESVKDEWCGNE